MVVVRCAWHRRYFGYPILCAIASWRGASVTFVDGMCGRCARRRRAHGRFHDAPAVSPIVPAWVPRLGLAAAFLVAILLAARPTEYATLVAPGRLVTAATTPAAFGGATVDGPATASDARAAVTGGRAGASEGRAAASEARAAVSQERAGAIAADRNDDGRQARPVARTRVCAARCGRRVPTRRVEFGAARAWMPVARKSPECVQVIEPRTTTPAPVIACSTTSFARVPPATLFTIQAP
jgi:hypothetical protein